MLATVQDVSVLSGLVIEDGDEDRVERMLEMATAQAYARLGVADLADWPDANVDAVSVIVASAVGRLWSRQENNPAGVIMEIMGEATNQFSAATYVPGILSDDDMKAITKARPGGGSYSVPIGLEPVVGVPPFNPGGDYTEESVPWGS